MGNTCTGSSQNPVNVHAGMVALPAADFPLQIFEARYRVLFHTLLDGEEGCEFTSAATCLCLDPPSHDAPWNRHAQNVWVRMESFAPDVLDAVQFVPRCLWARCLYVLSPRSTSKAIRQDKA